MLCTQEDGWSMFDRPFSAHHILIAFKAVWLKKKVNEGAVYPRWQWKDSQWMVLQASDGCIKRRWKSPKLNSQLSFEKPVGIIRGFRGKCDNGNLDWIIVEISAPFGRQMSRETSGDPIEVEGLPLVYYGNNEYVPHRGHLLKNNYNTRVEQGDGTSSVYVQLNLYSFFWLPWYLLVNISEQMESCILKRVSFGTYLCIEIFLLDSNHVFTGLISFMCVFSEKSK